ncbi:MAG: hypothetical protein GY943_12150, partial [Chloroflexi bacterium]|nr:hypothetical protein [Chloroflexota bacterium]
MKRYTITLLLLFFILIPSGVAFAGGATDRVVEPDDVIPNDVTIFDDNLEIKAGGRVNGDVVVWNGNANVAGTVRGDLIVINGDLDLEDVAEVRGECVVVNGQLNNDEDSNVTCTTVSGLPEIPGLGNLLNEIPNIPTETSVPVKHVDSLWVNLAEAVGQTLFFGFLAYVIASLLPQHMARIEDTMRSNPVASGGIGLLTSVAVP